MEDIGVAAIVVPILFLALPWLILHYVSKWKTSPTLTAEDENLLDELHDLSRRLDERMCTIERIIQADNPNWRALACDPADIGLEDQRVERRTGSRSRAFAAAPLAGGDEPDRATNQPPRRKA